MCNVVDKLSLHSAVIAHFRRVFLVRCVLRRPRAVTTAGMMQTNSGRAADTTLVCSRVAAVTTLFTTTNASRTAFIHPL